MILNLGLARRLHTRLECQFTFLVIMLCFDRTRVRLSRVNASPLNLVWTRRVYGRNLSFLRYLLYSSASIFAEFCWYGNFDSFANSTELFVWFYLLVRNLFHSDFWCLLRTYRSWRSELFVMLKLIFNKLIFLNEYVRRTESFKSLNIKFHHNKSDCQDNHFDWDYAFPLTPVYFENRMTPIEYRWMKW
jgi:hypothetical protein